MATKKKQNTNPETGEELEETVETTVEAVVEEKATYEDGKFAYKGKQYALSGNIPTFKLGHKVYTAEELPGKLKLVAQLIDLGFAGLVEVK